MKPLMYQVWYDGLGWRWVVFGPFGTVSRALHALDSQRHAETCALRFIKRDP